ncbi:MAG: RagB/SusD family nutrient uptake outer membrane protein [Bacteroidales bacterium]|jgi:hypothetical protein|nr:RagB/SusD family nutrient uptake outer membrane protein [Bacteroidales bacterium]
MKRINYILSVLTAMMFFPSCEEGTSMLDKENIGDLKEKDVFSNPTYARYFVADIYYKLPQGFAVADSWNGAYLDCATDNGEARNLDSDAHRFNNGNWNAESLPLGGVWSNDYASIRACNKFLENYNLIPEASGVMNRSDIEYLKAEIIFLRAFFYYHLIKHFGGIPIIDQTLNFDDQLLYSPRRTFAECVDFVVKECDEAAIMFRSITVPAGRDDYGRANEGTAMALKAQILFLAANPLYNRPDDYPQYDAGDSNTALWRYPNYDKERWRVAANALSQVIQTGKYSMFTRKAGTKTAYETYFVTRDTHEETILPLMKGASIDIYFNNLPFEFMLVSGKGSPVCYNLPTEDLVESYEMANGMLPDQPNSGYRPLHPYSGRDPRLNATIWYDAATFQDIEFQNWHRELTSLKTNGKHYITGYARTGFFLKKYMDKDLNPRNSGVVVPVCYPIIRYADILLSFAEAMNEYYDDPATIPGDSAKWAVDQIRNRAEMPSVDLTFANRGWTLNKENLRELIRNERRVEFAFEEYRFWDVRRWMIGTETQRIVHEQDILLKDDDKTKAYSVVKIENRAYENNMNHMPIPQVEINRSPALIQNWGWAPKSITQ